ncbi:uncharacterized protein [Palaemon carinicauda]|uniref:uncharacterized protein isoform X2 n=1 Tax=Palaemon carinicauda TaxID=392227 RepID=UPI0035B59A00
MEVARVKLKWNNHQCIFSHYLQDYCNQPMFSDAMIACEGRIFMVHRIILSTCSHYFEEIFQRSPNDNARPVIILNDTPVETIEWLLSYMYCGEVTIPKDSLSLLFKLAEQLKVKGLSHLQVPESEKKQTVPGEGEDSSSVPITLKRKLSDTPNTQTKKSTSSVSMGLQSDSTSYVLTPSLQTVTASPSNPSFPQGVSPLILTNSIAGSLPSSSIIIKPPSAGPLSNAIGTRVLSPPTGVVPQKVSSSVPIVTIPTSALPSSVQTSLNCSRMPILANHLLGKSTSTPSSMSSSTIVPPKPSPTVIITSTAKHNGSILAENETFNFMPAGTTTDYPLLTEIKEEVKEEPLTLGPDDPMCTDDVDDDDDDFSGWGFDDSPTLPENSSSVPAPTSKNSHMVALPTTMGSLNIAATFSMKNKSKRKQDISETIKEHANEAEGPKDKANGEEGGAPARLPHVLPQIVQPFMGVKAHVQVKSKDKKKKAYQPPGHFQGDQQQPHQLPTSDVEVSTKTLTSPDVQDIKKSFSPQKIQENAGAPCHVRVVKKTVKRDEFKMAKEVLDMKVRCAARGCSAAFTDPMGHDLCRAHAHCAISFSREPGQAPYTIWFPESCMFCYELSALLLSEEADDESLREARATLRPWVSGFGRNAPSGAPYLLDGDMASRLFPGSTTAAVPPETAAPLIEMVRATILTEEEVLVTEAEPYLGLDEEPRDEQVGGVELVDPLSPHTPSSTTSFHGFDKPTASPAKKRVEGKKQTFFRKKQRFAPYKTSRGHYQQSPIAHSSSQSPTASSPLQPKHPQQVVYLTAPPGTQPNPVWMPSPAYNPSYGPSGPFRRHQRGSYRARGQFRQRGRPRTRGSRGGKEPRFTPSQ